MGKKILIVGVGAQGSTVAQRMDEEPNVEKTWKPKEKTQIKNRGKKLKQILRTNIRRKRNKETEH